MRVNSTFLPATELQAPSPFIILNWVMLLFAADEVVVGEGFGGFLHLGIE
jgi:hypothetical protein